MTTADMASKPSPHVVVIGAGFGGLACVRAFRDANVDVTLVDRHNFHTFQPLLYQVATAGLNAADVAYPVRGILRRSQRAKFQLGMVTAVDTVAKNLTLDNGSVMPWDWLVVAAGATTNHFGVPGAAEFGLSLYTLEDATALRNHVLTRFEESASGANDDGALTFVVVGGGATGVEIAGALAELVDKVLRKDFPDLDVSCVKIILLEGQDRLLGPFAPKLSSHAVETLRSRSVDVRLNTPLSRVAEDHVVLGDGTILLTRTVVWAAGVKANALGALLGVELGRGGRIPIRPDLRLIEHDHVLAIGDIAAIDYNGRLAPQVAQVAIQSGRHAAETILAVEAGGATTPFAYKDKGSMATIGRNAAVAEFPNGLKLSGFIGWLSWLGLHILTMLGFRNRASVILNWAWNYVTWDRGPRLIFRKN
jgi:NADH:ubiquinone reductase (H+-translocating)